MNPKRTCGTLNQTLDRRRFLSAAISASALGAAALTTAKAQAPQQPISPNATPRDWSGASSPFTIPIRISSPSTIASAATSSATPPSSAFTPARCGPKVRRGMASAAISSGAIFPITSRCAGSKRTAVSRVFRNPSGYSNGNTFDFEGRQLSCEHGGRRVVRYEHERHGHRDRRQVRRQAAQFAQRHRGSSRWRHLVHRSDLRDPRQLRGLQGRQQN